MLRIITSGRAFPKCFAIPSFRTTAICALADVHRAKASNEELASSRSLGNRVRSLITGQEEADVINVRELNRKLTRMLEEEMTKNMALKEVSLCCGLRLSS